MDLTQIGKRGFGIDATVAPEVVALAAAAAENSGYASFWLNGSPPRGSLEGMAAAADACSLPIGTGVLPLDRRGIDDLVADVRQLGIPTERFIMGVGYGHRKDALATVRDAVATIRGELGATPIVGAFGPRMIELAGEIADAVIFTFWFGAAVTDGAERFRRAANQAGRPASPVISYIRTALLPSAQQRLNEISDHYDSIPKFRALYASHGIRAHDTIVSGADRAQLAGGIEAEEALLDLSIIRAITVDESATAILELLAAAAPA